MTENDVKAICETIQVLAKTLQETNFKEEDGCEMRNTLSRLSQAILNHSVEK